MGMCQAAKEAVWITGLLEDFGITLQSPVIIYGVNQGALTLAQNPVFHPHSKHIDVQYHFTCELVQSGRITVKYITMKAKIADGLTKSLPWPQHETLTKMLGVYQVLKEDASDVGEC